MTEPNEWDERVNALRAAGAPAIAPNGLRITCMRHDGLLLEHEHADHPDYKFPVAIEFVGTIPADCEHPDLEYGTETHAFLFSDGNVVLTLYECEYHLWQIPSGRYLGQREWLATWRISPASVLKLIDWATQHGRWPHIAR